MLVPILHGHGSNDLYESDLVGKSPQMSGARAPWTSGTDAGRYRIVLPCSGVFKHHLFDTKAAPAVGKTYSRYLTKSGVNYVSASIANPNTSGSNLSSVLAVAAGDIVTCYATGTAGCGTTRHRGAFLFDSPSGLIPFFSAAASATDVFSDLYGHVGDVEEHCACLVPIAGKFKRLYIHSPDAAGANLPVTLRKNYGNTALTATLPNGGQNASDLVNEVSFAAGDLVSLYANNAGGVRATISLVFQPDDPRMWFISACGGYTTFTTETLYNWLNGGLAHTTSSWQTPEDSGATYDFRLPWPKGPKITGMAAKVTTAPGAGKTRTFSLLKNSAASGLAVSISDANVYNLALGTLDPADWDNLSYKAEANAGTANSHVFVSLFGEGAVLGGQNVCVPRCFPATFVMV